MRSLPRHFKTLDGKWFTQVDKNDPLIHKLGETNFDRIVTENFEVLAEILADAGLIDGDSRLKLLAVQHDKGQVLNIDVLFAEIDGKTGDDGQFRRLIVIEDKLEKNAEQRRNVLAQIMDYARALQDRSQIAVFWDHLRRHFPEWTEANEEDIQTCLDEGNFLLVLAGDQFHPRLIDLVKHYQSRIDPTDLAEICLVSFAIFRGPDDMVTVIPNLVGAVTRGHRDITISVRVTSPTGERLRADVSEVVEAREGTQKIRRKRAWDRDAFLADLGRSSGPKAIEVARRIEDWAGTERLPVSWGGGVSDGYLILPFLAVRSRNDRFLEVDTKGRIWIYPAYIKDVPDYASEAARRTLLEQINEITGANIAPDKANSYTSLPLSAVADELKLRRFLSIAAEVYAKIRQHLER